MHLKYEKHYITFTEICLSLWLSHVSESIHRHVNSHSPVPDDAAFLGTGGREMLAPVAKCVFCSYVHSACVKVMHTVGSMYGLGLVGGVQS